MALIVRDARPKDVAPLYALGRGDVAFRVSERIPFYEREELVEWIAAPRDNILCVATDSQRIVGFFFCKVMSYHWAMLDNFYVVAQARRHGAGPLMFSALCARLRKRRIVYLTSLVESEREGLARLLRQRGFRFSKRYDWYELFLEG